LEYSASRGKAIDVFELFFVILIMLLSGLLRKGLSPLAITEVDFYANTMLIGKKSFLSGMLPA
jgi:hypothetical protein